MGFLALLVIVLIAVALLAPGKLTGASGSLGGAVRAFKEGLNGKPHNHARKPRKPE
jgi:Sec-independent protein translocase protein TatA